MDAGLGLSVGYQLPDRYRFADLVIAYADAISEVYFPWLGIPGGRGMSIAEADDQARMEAELKELRGHDIRLNLLCNANCYGGKAISVELERQIVSAVGSSIEKVGLDVVTTTSLFVAALIKSRFPQVEVRASVNMGIGTVSGMKYLKDYFDSFYLQRELNRFPARIQPLRTWCEANGKKLHLLANSGCLKNCSAHAFHDNLVSHEHELGGQPNAWTGFRGICWDYYRDPAHHYSFLYDSTWIRPEDLAAYQGLVDGIKLATRSHDDPALVIDSYVRRQFNGNMLALCEPDFSGLCHLDNSRFPVAWSGALEPLSDREQEAYCREVMAHVKC